MFPGTERDVFVMIVRLFSTFFVEIDPPLPLFVSQIPLLCALFCYIIKVQFSGPIQILASPPCRRRRSLPIVCLAEAPSRGGMEAAGLAGVETASVSPAKIGRGEGG